MTTTSKAKAISSVSEIKLSDLKPSTYNPATRLRDVESLANDMEEMGQLYPILIDVHNVIVDGHRLVAAAKRLKWETIEALVTEKDARRAYASVNAQSRKLSGNETLSVYLQEPEAVTAMLRARFAEAESAIGRKMLSDLVKRGMSIRIWNRAKQIASYCGVDDLSFTKEILNWLLAFGPANVIEAMARGVRADKIVACVDRMKPLKATFAVGE